MSLKKAYLLLAIIGAIAPYYFYVRFVFTEGFNISLFISSLFNTMPAAGFSTDVLLATVAFWLFIFKRYSLGNSPKPTLYFILSCTVGLSCALPAYLYANEK